MSQCIMCNGHRGTPEQNLQMDTCENITFPQRRSRAVKMQNLYVMFTGPLKVK